MTGPSLVNSTAMFAPKEPVATVAPRLRNSSTSTSIRRLASSGAAAAMNDGRRPLRVSPYRVNWLTTSTSPLVSATERFMWPLSSAKMRRCHSLEASLTAAWSSSPWVTPTRQHRPGPISPTTRPSTRTRASEARCTSALTGPAYEWRHPDPA